MLRPQPYHAFLRTIIIQNKAIVIAHPTASVFYRRNKRFLPTLPAFSSCACRNSERRKKNRQVT
ncbi:MAG: hypothetical protein MSH18_06260, partial [Bacteroidales bacterium]|nr:hypothetical protein [Bacteroidales bacterium]